MTRKERPAMASEALLKRLADVKRDLASVLKSTNFNPIRNMSALKEQYDATEKLGKKWHDKAEPWLPKIDDDALEPLVVFCGKLSILRTVADQVNPSLTH
jgi:hypothetical protein